MHNISRSVNPIAVCYFSGLTEKIQNVVTRAQLIPAISSALGNLMSTQSPTLCRKIESLVAEPDAGFRPDKVLDELHRRTQILLLRSARDQKIKMCLPRVKSQSAQPSGLVLSEGGSSAPNTSADNQFTNYASLDLVDDIPYGSEDGQSPQSISGLPDHGWMHLESENSRGFTTYRPDGGFDLLPEAVYTDSDLRSADWVDDDVVPCTSESLLEYGEQYNEHCVGDEVLDPTCNEQEYQDEHLAPDDADQEYYLDTANRDDESDRHGYYYEVSDIEGGVHPTAYAFEAVSAESISVAGALEDPRDDDSDLMADEDDDVLGDDVYEHLSDHVTYPGEGENDLLESDGDYDREDVFGWDNMDHCGPEYIITTGHFQHDDHVEVDERNARVGWHSQLLQDWSQVPRSNGYHGTWEQRARSGPHPVALTSRLADRQ